MPKSQVKIVSPGTKVVSLVKTLRLVADLGLGDAKNLSDYLRGKVPCVLVAGVDREVADHAASLLREAGAEVAVEDSSIEVPMLLSPEANQRYQWTWLGKRTPVTMPVEIECECGYKFTLWEIKLTDEQKREAKVTGRLPEVVVRCKRPGCEGRILLTDSQVERLLRRLMYPWWKRWWLSLTKG
jgi:hypothetical protein